MKESKLLRVTKKKWGVVRVLLPALTMDNEATPTNEATPPSWKQKGAVLPSLAYRSIATPKLTFREMVAEQWGSDSWSQSAPEAIELHRRFLAYPHLTDKGEEPINPFTGTAGVVRKLIPGVGRFKKDSFGSGCRRLRAAAKLALRERDYRLYEAEESKYEVQCFSSLC